MYIPTWIEVQVFKWENKEGEIDFDKRGGGNERGVWKTKIDFDKHGGVIFFCGGRNCSKSVTFIRDMRVVIIKLNW